MYQCFLPVYIIIKRLYTMNAKKNSYNSVFFFHWKSRLFHWVGKAYLWVGNAHPSPPIDTPRTVFLEFCHCELQYTHMLSKLFALFSFCIAFLLLNFTQPAAYLNIQQSTRDIHTSTRRHIIFLEPVAICYVVPNCHFIWMVPEVSTRRTTLLKMSAVNLILPGLK